MDVLSAGMAAITDSVEALYIAEKIISAKKNVLADIEIFSTRIDALYKNMVVVSKILAITFISLEAGFTAKKTTLITKQGTYIMASVFLHLDDICYNLDRIRIECKKIHGSLSSTFGDCEDVSENINKLLEELEDAYEVQEALFAEWEATATAEHIETDVKGLTIFSKILEIFSLKLKLLSIHVNIVTNTVDCMHSGIKVLQLRITIASKYVKKAMENIKGAYEGLKSLLP